MTVRHSPVDTDFNSVVEKTERMKRRWQKVIENRQILKLDSERLFKVKFDKLTKREKSRRKYREDTVEDLKLIAEKHNERLETAKKRRDFLKDDFEKGLKIKEQHYNDRMQQLINNSQKQASKDLEMLASPKHSEALTVTPKRAQTAMSKYRSNSVKVNAFENIDDDEEEEDLQRRLEDLENMLQRAENLR
jgi:hypothetical protein